MSSYDEKRAAFMKRIKYDVGNQQGKSAKQAQFASANKNSSSSSNKAGAPDRQKAKMTGKGKER